MGWVETYICSIYAFIMLMALVGAFSHTFDANIIQKIALTMFAIWSAWRIELILERGWGYPHETMVATALCLFAIGSLVKAIHYLKLKPRSLSRTGGTDD